MNNFEILDHWIHTKASEEHIYAKIVINKKIIKLLIPIVERRTNVDIDYKDKFSLKKHIEKTIKIYEDKKKIDAWKKKSKEFWRHSKSTVTKPVFDSLYDGTIKCNACEMPRNTNLQRRIQDIKEFGFTLGTFKFECKSCKKKTYHYQLIFTERVGDGSSDYELFTKKEIVKIKKILQNYDSYENNFNSKSLVIEHKFPEIRWDEEVIKMKKEKLKELNEKYIIDSFQLMNNQRNQQKREVCRRCYQKNIRGFPFGIKFFYHGNEMWNTKIPKKGKNAEKGCFGCGWYDLKKWREELDNFLND